MVVLKKNPDTSGFNPKESLMILFSSSKTVYGLEDVIT